MYDDNRYSPCYGGYSIDDHVCYICCIEQSLVKNTYDGDITSLNRESAHLYNRFMQLPV